MDSHSGAWKRLIIAVLVGIAVVVVVLKNDAQPPQLSKDQARMAFATTLSRRACVKQLLTSIRQTESTDLFAAADNVEWSKGAVIGTVNEDGEPVVKPLVKGMTVNTADRRALKQAKSGRHRRYVFPQKMLFMFANNLCVAVDTPHCRVSGVFMPQKNGKAHPAIEKDLRNSLIREDSPCTQKKYCRCEDYPGRPIPKLACSTGEHTSDQDCYLQCNNRNMRSTTCDSCDDKCNLGGC